MPPSLGEEAIATITREYDRPGDGEPEYWLTGAAEGLHLVDVGGLEGEHRKRRDAEAVPT